MTVSIDQSPNGTLLNPCPYPLIASKASSAYREGLIADNRSRGKTRSAIGIIDPLKISCGTVNRSSQFVLVIAPFDNAETRSPTIPPVNPIRKTVIPKGRRTCGLAGMPVAMKWMLVQTNPW